MSKHPLSIQLADWDRQYVWHPFAQMKEWEEDVPLIIERGKGPYLFDIEGRRYLDGVSSLWVNIHGHRHPVIDKAVRSQLKKISHSTLLGLSNPPAIQLARELVHLAPPGLTRVFYSDDGSTAVEIALKIAVQYWQQRNPSTRLKQKFVRLALAYHGDTVGAMSVSGVELFQERFRPLLFPSVPIDSPYCYRCPLQLKFPSCQMACIDPLEELLAKECQEIAGIIVEPLIQAVAGMVTAPAGYLAKVRELCSKYKVLMIADEVATGFGRTGKMFACEHEDVAPDLMTIAKGLTGGYLPLGATLATEEIYQAFLGEYGEWKTFFHGHSYTGNPLGCAAALANLEIFKTERTLSKVQKHISILQHLLKPIAHMPHVGDVRQFGYMVGIELVKNKDTREPFSLTLRIGHKVMLEARQRGLLIRPIGNVIVLVPPLTTSVKELRQMVAIVGQSIESVGKTMQGMKKTHNSRSEGVS